MMLNENFVTWTIAALFSLLFTTGEYIPKWSCDFENGFCDWLQVTEGGLNWTHTDGHKIGLPDHTSKSLDGKFLKFSIVGSERYGTAKLMSPILQPTNGSCKMVFYYAFDNRRKSYHLFYVKVNKVTRRYGSIFRQSMLETDWPVGFSWQRFELSLESDVEFQIEIVGHSSVWLIWYDTFVAIDDVMFTDGCLTNERTPIKIVKPPLSSSYNVPEGLFYEKVNGSYSTVCSAEKASSACKLLGLNDIARSESSKTNSLESGQTLCLPNNFTLPNEKGCYRRTMCRNVTYWSCKKDYIIQCPGLTHKTCTSSLASPKCYSYNQECDFVPDCPGSEDEADCLAFNRCDFQKDFCNWVPSKNTVLEWKRYRRRGASEYVLKVINSHDFYKTGAAKLRLKEALIRGSHNATCILRFSYRMESFSSPTLKVVLTQIHLNTTQKDLDIWTNDLSARSKWSTVYAEIRQPGFIQFEAKMKFADDGGFALANVSFSRECVFLNHTNNLSRNASDLFLCPESGEYIQRARVCNFYIDCHDGNDEVNCSRSNGDCTFDQSLCSWKIGQNVPAVLIRREGSTPTGATGPRKDHTNRLASGYYVYLEASWLVKGDFGYLTSNMMRRPESGKCTFRWFYHMYNKYYYGMGALYVIYYDPLTRTNRTLWHMNGHQLNDWVYGTVTFDVVSFHYQIILKAVRGSTARSDIAIDDVSFSEDCYKIPKYAPLSIRQDCDVDGTYYSIDKQSASVFFSYNNSIGPNINCNWYISTDSRLRISLSTEHFVTGSGDVISIEAGSVKGREIGGKYSGLVAPFYLISSSNTMHIQFLSTNLNSSKGFAFNISSTNTPANASTTYKAPQECSGRVSSFKFLDKKTIRPRVNWGWFKRYRSNENCVYTFYAFTGYRLKFRFKMFKTERSHDYIEVLNNQIVGRSKFSGEFQPFYFVSKNSILSFRFKTDASVEKEGFRLLVSATTELARGMTSDFPSLPPTTPWPWWSTPHWTRIWWRTTGAVTFLPESKDKQAGGSKSTTTALIAFVCVSSFVVAAFVACKLVKRRSQRIARERARLGNGSAFPANGLSVRYVPDPHENDAPPSYFDATKTSVFFLNTAYGATGPFPPEAPPSFDEVLRGDDRICDIPPKYESIFNDTTHSSQGRPDETDQAHLNILSGMRHSARASQVNLPAVEQSAIVTSSTRPASACSIESTDSTRPLFRSAPRQQRNPATVLPSIQVRVRAVDNRGSLDNPSNTGMAPF